MQNPTHASIIIPATGAPTCRGIELRVRSLHDWFREDDLSFYASDLVRWTAARAISDGHVLCLRPTDTRHACVGLTATHFADASLQADFAARALVVDPYDAHGNDLRETVAERIAGQHASARLFPKKSGRVALTAEEARDVVVWEGSEAV